MNLRPGNCLQRSPLPEVSHVNSDFRVTPISVTEVTKFEKNLIYQLVLQKKHISNPFGEMLFINVTKFCQVPTHLIENIGQNSIEHVKNSKKGSN